MTVSGFVCVFVEDHIEKFGQEFGCCGIPGGIGG